MYGLEAKATSISADASLHDTSWVYEDDGGGTSVDFLPDDVQGWVERP